MLVTCDEDPEGPDSTQMPTRQNDDDDPEDLGLRILDRQTILQSVDEEVGDGSLQLATPVVAKAIAAANRQHDFVQDCPVGDGSEPATCLIPGCPVGDGSEPVNCLIPDCPVGDGSEPANCLIPGCPVGDGSEPVNCLIPGCPVGDCSEPATCHIPLLPAPRS